MFSSALQSHRLINCAHGIHTYIMENIQAKKGKGKNPPNHIMHRDRLRNFDRTAKRKKPPNHMHRDRLRNYNRTAKRDRKQTFKIFKIHKLNDQPHLVQKLDSGSL